MKTIYICGKVTGDASYLQKFLAEGSRLRSFGYDDMNPATFIRKDAPWDEAMKKAIRAMLRCDGVSLLPDWKKSKGAKIEVRLAKELGMEVRDNIKWA